jgi:hypothetical protein
LNSQTADSLPVPFDQLAVDGRVFGESRLARTFIDEEWEAELANVLAMVESCHNAIEFTDASRDSSHLALIGND